MLFNSLHFLFFFLIVTSMYYLSPYRWRWLLLLISSCAFYMFFIPVYILILFAIIGIDYTTAFFIEKAQGRQRKIFLSVSLLINIGVLFFFKYYNFFLGNIDHLFQACNVTIQWMPYLHIILPLGLSFHTFQAMSYSIEVYRGHQKAERHLGIYALYVMFYPQLVAGPIERPQNLLPQFHSHIPFSYENLLSGLRLMMWGLFKKAVVADRVSGYANPIFDHPASYHNLQILAGVLAFTIQIYCDFSGYTDMALGAARCMGFKLMTNFSRPYFATNIQQFWTRWHISLTTWFRDYVYVSLGGNRVGKWRRYFNIFIVFLLSGFWHGANWTFLIWGCFHAALFFLYLSVAGIVKRYSGWFMRMAGWLTTFFSVMIGWIFFRAEDISKAWLMLSRIFTPDRSYYVFSD
jgi:alginate O-acetyltransferase complex protein AlgI